MTNMNVESFVYSSTISTTKAKVKTMYSTFLNNTLLNPL